MILLREPTDWFVQVVNPLSVRETTKAYVVGVFVSLLRSQEFQINSTVLAYAHACATGRFERFQELGDWILWSMAFVPGSHAGHESIVMDVGRRSYETCWRLLRGKWDLYAELADEFPTIIEGVRYNLK